MFEDLFAYPRTRLRHRTGPLVNERLAYLDHLARAGMSRAALRGTADHILVIADQLALASRAGEIIRCEEILRAATGWADRPPGSRHRKGGPTSCRTFRLHATRWLQFLGRLEQHRLLSSYAEQIADFADYLHGEQGLSSATISKRCRFVQRFLDQFGTGGSLCEINLTRIDQALMEMIAAGRCARTTVQYYASNMRSFFRYAEMRGWCRKGLAVGIRGPRIFVQETLPTGPSWDHVQHILATSREIDPPTSAITPF